MYSQDKFSTLRSTSSPQYERREDIANARRCRFDKTLNSSIFSPTCSFSPYVLKVSKRSPILLNNVNILRQFVTKTLRSRERNQVD